MQQDLNLFLQRLNGISSKVTEIETKVNSQGISLNNVHSSLQLMANYMKEILLKLNVSTPTVNLVVGAPPVAAVAAPVEVVPIATQVAPPAIARTAATVPRIAPVRQPRQSINDALVAPPINRTSNTRGATIPAERIDRVMQHLYSSPKQNLAQISSKAAPFLMQQTTDVWGQIFDKKPGADLKIKKVLCVWDAVWTLEEREKLCRPSNTQHPDGRLSNGDAYSIINFISQRVRQCCHVMQKETPPTSKPTDRSRYQISGLANKLSQYSVERLLEFVPNWDDPDLKRASLVSLTDYCKNLENQIEFKIRARKAREQAERAYGRGRGRG